MAGAALRVVGTLPAFCQFNLQKVSRLEVEVSFAFTYGR